MIKKTVLSFMFFLQLSFIISQPFGEAAKNFHITKSIYKNSSGERASTIFKYDSSGQLSTAIWSLDDKSRSSKNDYQYDENGLLRSTYREFSDSLTSFELFSYDKMGNKIFEEFVRSDGIKGSANYSYDGKLLKEACYNNYKGWLLGNVKYLYENGRKSKASIYKNDTLICNITFEYNDQKNLIKKHWDFNGSWSQTFNYVYEKNHAPLFYYSNPFATKSCKFKIISENYTFNNEIGGPSFYYYDSKGLMHEKKFIRSDSISTLTSYQYDEKRRLISSFRKYSHNDNTHFTYDYDQDDNLILRTAIKNDSVIGFESYFYNHEGQLKKAHFKNFDQWISGDITFQYNNLDQLTSGKFRGLDGFDAKLTFTSNKEGLISEILWEFSFGKYQRYEFIYEKVAN